MIYPPPYHMQCVHLQEHVNTIRLLLFPLYLYTHAENVSLQSIHLCESKYFLQSNQQLQTVDFSNLATTTKILDFPRNTFIFFHIYMNTKLPNVDKTFMLQVASFRFTSYFVFMSVCYLSASFSHLIWIAAPFMSNCIIYCCCEYTCVRWRTTNNTASRSNIRHTHRSSQTECLGKFGNE